MTACIQRRLFAALVVCVSTALAYCGEDVAVQQQEVVSRLESAERKVVNLFVALPENESAARARLLAVLDLLARTRASERGLALADSLSAKDRLSKTELEAFREDLALIHSATIEDGPSFQEWFVRRLHLHVRDVRALIFDVQRLELSPPPKQKQSTTILPDLVSDAERLQQQFLRSRESLRLRPGETVLRDPFTELEANTQRVRDLFASGRTDDSPLVVLRRMDALLQDLITATRPLAAASPESPTEPPPPAKTETDSASKPPPPLSILHYLHARQTRLLDATRLARTEGASDLSEQTRQQTRLLETVRSLIQPSADNASQSSREERDE